MTTDVKKLLEDLAGQYLYRPLPTRVKAEVYPIYKAHLNGFEEGSKRKLTIQGTEVASTYSRIVVGDYGAWVEFGEEDLLVPLDIAKGQEWRFDSIYLASRGLNIKYQWLDYQGVKVYKQVATVKYADYLPGKFYISVLDFDKSEGSDE